MEKETEKQNSVVIFSEKYPKIKSPRRSIGRRIRKIRKKLDIENLEFFIKKENSYLKVFVHGESVNKIKQIISENKIIFWHNWFKKHLLY